jgi:hypothetical protein
MEKMMWWDLMWHGDRDLMWHGDLLNQLQLEQNRVEVSCEEPSYFRNPASVVI